MRGLELEAEQEESPVMTNIKKVVSPPGVSQEIVRPAVPPGFLSSAFLIVPRDCLPLGPFAVGQGEGVT